MARIFIRGQHEPYEIPDDVGHRLKSRWLAGTLPQISEVGAITIRSSEIKMIETLEDRMRTKEAAKFPDYELDALESELEPYKIKNPYPQYKVEKYLPIEGIRKYLTDNNILNANGALVNPMAHDRFSRMLAAISDRKRQKQWGSEQELKEYDEMHADLIDEIDELAASKHAFGEDKSYN